MDYVRLGPFTVKAKILEVMYKLDLLEKIRVYPIQHVIILELVYRNIKPLVYKADIYRGQKEDKWEVLRIIGYKDINNEI